MKFITIILLTFIAPQLLAKQNISKANKTNAQNWRWTRNIIKSSKNERSLLFSLALAGVKKSDLALILNDLKKVKKYPQLEILSHQVMIDRKYSGAQFFLQPLPLISIHGELFKYDIKKSFFNNYTNLKDKLSQSKKIPRGLAEATKKQGSQWGQFIVSSALLSGVIYSSLKQKLRGDKAISLATTAKDALSFAEKVKPLCFDCDPINDPKKDLQEEYYKKQRLETFSKFFGKSFHCSRQHLSFTTDDKHFILVSREYVSPTDKNKILNLDFDLSRVYSGSAEMNEEEIEKLKNMILAEKIKQSQFYTVTAFNNKIETVKVSEENKETLRDLAAHCDSKKARDLIVKTYFKSINNFISVYSEDFKQKQGNK